MGCYCDGEEGELPTVSTVAWRKARKAHRCCECKDLIRPGERYEHTTGLWDGRWETYRTCDDCVDTREKVHELADFMPAFGSAACCLIQAMREIET